MRKVGKIIDFTPYEEVKNKDGATVIGKNDGLAVMKRTVVVDCSRISEDGDEIREAFVCDMYNDITDERLEQLRQSGQRMAFYIFMDYYKSADGRYFQRVTLRKINDVNA